jgi:hypothetical protein
MSETEKGFRRPRMIRAARDLRRGDIIEIGREVVTVSFASWEPARLDQRAMEILTRGMDKEGSVSIQGKTVEGRTVRHEFGENDIVTIY